MSHDQIMKLRKKQHDDRYDRRNRNLPKTFGSKRGDIRVRPVKRQ